MFPNLQNWFSVSYLTVAKENLILPSVPTNTMARRTKRAYVFMTSPSDMAGQELIEAAYASVEHNQDWASIPAKVGLYVRKCIWSLSSFSLYLLSTMDPA